MRKIKRRWKILMACLLTSFVWSLISYFLPGDKFVGSPPNQGLHRNNMNLSDHGAWWGKYGKQFRPRVKDGDQWKLILPWNWGPSLFLTPIIQHFAGWDVYGDICVEGKTAIIPKISDDDGDILIPILLEPKDAHYGWRKNYIADKINAHNWILVEIDNPIRNNFPILPDLNVNDKVKICGLWVFDCAHKHNEIHPARWVEIESLSDNNVPPSPPKGSNGKEDWWDH